MRHWVSGQRACCAGDPKGQQLVSDKVKVLDLDASHRGPSVATEYQRVLFPEAGVAPSHTEVAPGAALPHMEQYEVVRPRRLPAPRARRALPSHLVSLGGMLAQGVPPPAPTWALRAHFRL